MFNLRIALILSLGFVVAGAGQAKAQSLEIFGGYSAANMKPGKDYSSNTTHGWNASVTGYAGRRFGLTADVAGFSATVHPEGTANNLDVRQYSFLGGPQIRLIRGRYFESSFRALVGAARAYVPSGSLPVGFTDDSLDQTKFAALFGSNFDFKISRLVALRFSPGLYLTQFGAGQTQKNFRFSIGPVFKFGHED